MELEINFTSQQITINQTITTDKINVRQVINNGVDVIAVITIGNMLYNLVLWQDDEYSSDINYTEENINARVKQLLVVQI